MKKILITGANGFIGKNLQENLRRLENIKIYTFDIENSLNELETMIKEVDFIYHLAGINRPKNPKDFYKGNSDLVGILTSLLEKYNKNTPILITSSIQAIKDNDYGKSKLSGENLLKEYAKRNQANIYIYRLANVFGKWCKPNYNSVIATWCHNIANNIDIMINDRNTIVEFVYIDDVIETITQHLINSDSKEKSFYYKIPVSYMKKLGEIEQLLKEFKMNRKNLIIQHIGTGFERALYATYLSYLSPNDFSYTLNQHLDNRGSFVEILKTLDSGQISISTSKPGITRGNHYHNTKNEKFLVIKGKAQIKFRHILNSQIIEYNVSDEKLEIVDVPVGYTHNITNIGSDEMILIIWANEQFDKNNPDTYFLEV